MGFRLRKFGSKTDEHAGKGRNLNVADRSGEGIEEVQSGSEAGVSPDELYDFLSADVLHVQADPKFKEALRRKLWAMVKDRYGRGGPRGL